MAEKLSPTELVGQLLLQADSTTSEAEKLVFFGRAQRIASINSIDMAIARRMTAQGMKREDPTQKSVTIGKAGQRALAWYVELYIAIARNNDLKITMAHNSTFVSLYGFPSDIEVAESIYLSAVTAMASLADAYLKEGSYKKDVQPRRVKIRTDNPDYHGGYYGEPKYNYRWTYVDKCVSGMTARQNFYEGFVNKIANRLAEAKRTVESEQLTVEQLAILGAATGDDGAEMSTALVLADKAKEVDEFYAARMGGRRLRGWNGSSTPVYSAGAQGAGSRAAAGVALGGRNAPLPGARKALGS